MQLNFPWQNHHSSNQPVILIFSRTEEGLFPRKDFYKINPIVFHFYSKLALFLWQLFLKLHLRSINLFFGKKITLDLNVSCYTLTKWTIWLFNYWSWQNDGAWQLSGWECLEHVIKFQGWQPLNNFVDLQTKLPTLIYVLLKYRSKKFCQVNGKI